MYFPHQYAARGTSPRCSPAFAGLISLFTHLGPPSTVAPGLAGSKCHVFQLHGYAVFAQLRGIIAGCSGGVNRSRPIWRRDPHTSVSSDFPSLPCVGFAVQYSKTLLMVVSAYFASHGNVDTTRTLVSVNHQTQESP